MRPWQHAKSSNARSGTGSLTFRFTNSWTAQKLLVPTFVIE